jgi:cytochrome c-type biogenesis protein
VRRFSGSSSSLLPTPRLSLLSPAAAVGIASPLFGAIMLLVFAIGRAIPIALGAWAAGWLENLSVLSKYQKGFEIAGAVTLIASGLYMLNALTLPGDVAPSAH